MMGRAARLWGCAAGLLLSGSIFAAEKAPYSPGVRDRNLPDQLLWGDTHLHTRLSADAYMSGTKAFTPEMAYRFARGETVTSSTGVKTALRDPLDFLVISDQVSRYLCRRGGCRSGFYRYRVGKEVAQVP